MSCLGAQVIEAQKLKPLFVNSHSGNDYWSMEQAEEFFGRALEWQEQEGAVVGAAMPDAHAVLPTPQQARVADS